MRPFVIDVYRALRSIDDGDKYGNAPQNCVWEDADHSGHRLDSSILTATEGLDCPQAPAVDILGRWNPHYHNTRPSPWGCGVLFISDTVKA